jgi:DNA-binding CsgD family transcriptional regulator
MSEAMTSPVIGDLRAMLRLVRQVQNLPPNREKRKRFVVCTLCGVLGARVGLALDIKGLMPGCDASIDDVTIAPDGVGRNGQALPPLQEDLLTEPLLGAILNRLNPDGVTTVLRSDLIADDSWRASDRFKEFYSDSNVGDAIWSLRPGGASGEFHALAFYGGSKVTPFAPHERMIVHALHSELDAMYDCTGTPACERTMQSLTPRENEVLSLLLGGDSEKLIAYKIGISRNTIHDYVKTIYRQFNVASRPELMSQFIPATMMAK